MPEAKKISPSRMSSGDKIYRDLYQKIFPIPKDEPSLLDDMFVIGVLVAAAAALEAVGFDYSRQVPVS